MSKMTEKKGKREQREKTGEGWKPQIERRMEERQEQERKKGHKKTSQGKENVDALRIVQFDETSRPFTDPDQIEEPRSPFCSVCLSRFWMVTKFAGGSSGCGSTSVSRKILPNLACNSFANSKTNWREL